MNEKSVVMLFNETDVNKILTVIEKLNGEEKRYTTKIEPVNEKTRLTVYANDPLHFLYLGMAIGKVL